MKLPIFACLALCLLAPAGAEERYSRLPQVEHPSMVEQLRFLRGTWVSVDPNSKIVESWAPTPDGHMIGMRQGLGFEYDFFAMQPGHKGSSLFMRRMELHLRDLEPTPLFGGVYADYTNKATVIFSDLSEKPNCEITMAYDSPSPDELNLALKTIENGQTSTQAVHYKRAKQATDLE